MTVTITGGNDWHPRVVVDEDDLQVRYDCPTCPTTHTINVQPLPWSVPAASELHPTVDGGEAVDDDRRRAGTVDHADLDTVTTQLWCHRCGHGADVKLHIDVELHHDAGHDGTG